MRLAALGGVIVVLALAGCGSDGDRELKSKAAAHQDADASVDPSASKESGLRNGVTRSPKRGAPPPADSTGEPDSDSAPKVKPVKVTLVRSGGFAGGVEKVVVATNGSWTFTSRADDRDTGRLTGAQTARLHQWARDPRLAREATAGGGGKPGFQDQCPDAFRYQLDAGEVTVIQSGCGDQPKRPIFHKIVGLLSERTSW